MARDSRLTRKPPDPHHGAFMTFDEIGKALGITRGGAWMAYKSAMRKLARRCHATQLELMRELAASKGRAV